MFHLSLPLPTSQRRINVCSNSLGKGQTEIVLKWITSWFVLLQMDYSEFVVTSNVLDLVYGQGLVWLGLYFSPLMALVAVVKLFIVFYFRYFVARFANIPPKKMFRASRSGSFYLFLLLITWILCFIPVVYILIEWVDATWCFTMRIVSYITFRETVR